MNLNPLWLQFNDKNGKSVFIKNLIYFHHSVTTVNKNKHRLWTRSPGPWSRKRLQQTLNFLFQMIRAGPISSEYVQPDRPGQRVNKEHSVIVTDWIKFDLDQLNPNVTFDIKSNDRSQFAHSICYRAACRSDTVQTFQEETFKSGTQFQNRAEPNLGLIRSESVHLIQFGSILQSECSGLPAVMHTHWECVKEMLQWKISVCTNFALISDSYSTKWKVSQMVGLQDSGRSQREHLPVKRWSSQSLLPQ